MLKERRGFQHEGGWSCLLGDLLSYFTAMVPSPSTLSPCSATTDLRRQRAEPTSEARPQDAGAASARPSKPVAPSCCSVGQTGRPGRGWSKGTARKPCSDEEDTGLLGGQGCAAESRVQSRPGHDPNQSPEEGCWLRGAGASGPCLAELQQGLYPAQRCWLWRAKGSFSGVLDHPGSHFICEGGTKVGWGWGGDRLLPISPSFPLLNDRVLGSGRNFWVVWLLLPLGTTVSFGLKHFPSALKQWMETLASCLNKWIWEFLDLEGDCTKGDSDGFPEWETRRTAPNLHWKLAQWRLIKYLKLVN